MEKNESTNCKIWEAIRATMAHPRLFKPISISGVGGIEECFVDGGIRCNNPSKQVLSEAQSLFGKKPINVFLSLGSGHQGVIGSDTQKVAKLADLLPMLQDIAFDCQQTADEVTKLFDSASERYFRWNVAQGTSQIQLEDWTQSGDILSHTMAYLLDIDISGRIDLLVDFLCNSSNGIPLCSLLSGFSTGQVHNDTTKLSKLLLIFTHVYQNLYIFIQILAISFKNISDHLSNSRLMLPVWKELAQVFWKG